MLALLLLNAAAVALWLLLRCFCANARSVEPIDSGSADASRTFSSGAGVVSWTLDGEAVVTHRQAPDAACWLHGVSVWHAPGRERE
jgi:hypothetical protein